MPLAPQYQFKLDSMPRGKDLGIPITHTCNVPTQAVSVDFALNCLVCYCDGWLPVPVGTVNQFDSLESVWNSPLAQEIQQDVLDKKYTWCAVDHCGVVRHNQFLDRANLAINVDDSCNLACPSCRRDKIMLDKGPEFERRLHALETVLGWLEKYTDPITVTLGGNGDPLASHIIRPLFHNYQPKPNQDFVIHTNGLLLRKQLETSAILPHISAIKLSVDAGTSITYEKVRRGGSWLALIDNLDFIRTMGLEKLTTLKFCLQQANYLEVPKFVELCETYGFRAHIHQLDDWGTWSDIMPANPDTWTLKNGIFQDHNVLDTRHPGHAECMSILRHIQTNYHPPQVFIDGAIIQRL